MTSNKYIVKNCPCFFEENEEVNDYTCAWGGTEEYACQDCTDCLLKQIVKKCRKSLEVSYCPIEQEILELLDIQEVE